MCTCTYSLHSNSQELIVTLQKKKNHTHTSTETASVMHCNYSLVRVHHDLILSLDLYGVILRDTCILRHTSNV